MIARCLAMMVLLSAAGCGGGSAVDVEGRVYFGSEAIIPEGRRVVRVTLIAETPTNDESGAVTSNLDESGLFRFSRLSPGRYVATVVDYPGPQQGDRLAGGFASLEEPIVLEVNGEVPLEIRLPKEWAH